MELDLFENLPSDIITEILSRLPVRTIATCKCVGKSWLQLIESPQFAKHHLSKSVPCLAIQSCKKPCQIDEIFYEENFIYAKRIRKFDC